MSLAGGARLEDIFAMVQRGEVATLNLVLKADVQGSLEALTDSLRKLDQEHEEVRLSFVHRAVGGINESDINLASVSNATVIGFNVRPDRKARDLARIEGVEMRLYEVIYQVLEDVQSALLGMLKPEFEEVVTGDAEVREIFRIPRVGAIAGCYVQSGVITRGSKVRFLREGVIIWKGAISSLKRFKEDAREVREGFECGIGLSDFQDLKQGDVIETFEEREVVRS
jgi:translation initiation factor IF-2